MLQTEIGKSYFIWCHVNVLFGMKHKLIPLLDQSNAVQPSFLFSFECNWFILYIMQCITQVYHLNMQVLYLVEPIDEVAIQNLDTYKEKKFVDISKEDLELGQYILIFYAIQTVLNWFVKSLCFYLKTKCLVFRWAFIDTEQMLVSERHRWWRWGERKGK